MSGYLPIPLEGNTPDMFGSAQAYQNVLQSYAQRQLTGAQTATEQQRPALVQAQTATEQQRPALVQAQTTKQQLDNALQRMQIQAQINQASLYGGGGAGQPGAPAPATSDGSSYSGPGVALGMRQNNPLNLEFAGQPGAATAQSNRFGVYSDMPSGVAATADQLALNQSQHGLNTVRGQVTRWVSDPKADLTTYIGDISKALGVTPDTPLDFTDPKVQAAYIQAAQPHESAGGGAALRPQDVQAGVQMAAARRGNTGYVAASNPPPAQGPFVGATTAAPGAQNALGAANGGGVAVGSDGQRYATNGPPAAAAPPAAQAPQNALAAQAAAQAAAQPGPNGRWEPGVAGPVPVEMAMQARNDALRGKSPAEIGKWLNEQRNAQLFQLAQSATDEQTWDANVQIAYDKGLITTGDRAALMGNFQQHRDLLVQRLSSPETMVNRSTTLTSLGLQPGPGGAGVVVDPTAYLAKHPPIETTTPIPGQPGMYQKGATPSTSVAAQSGAVIGPPSSGGPAVPPAPSQVAGALPGTIATAPPEADPAKAAEIAARAAEQRETSTALGQVSGDIVRNEAAAPTTLTQASDLEHAAELYRTGTTGTQRASAYKLMTDALGAMGVQPPSWLNAETQGSAVIEKLGAFLAANAVQKMGDRAASVFNSLKAVQPGIEQTPEGYQAVLNSIKQSAVRDQDLGRFRTTWLQTHGSIDGMVDQFNQTHSVDSYASHVIPFPLPANKQYEPGVLYRARDGRTVALWTGQGFMMSPSGH